MRRSRTAWHLLKNIMRLVVILMLFVALYSYAMFQGGFVSWFLFYSATVLVILVCLYALLPLGDLQIYRDFGNQAIAAKSTVTVTVTIRRKWPLPFLYLVVEDKIEKDLEKQISIGSHKKVFYPSFKKELSYSYEIPAVKRGEYSLYGMELETSDMFGLLYKRKYIEARDTLLVIPNYHHMEKWSPYEKRDAERRLSSFDFIEELTSVAGARDYEPGDKLTTIDWKVTARSNKLMTKEFEQELGQRYLVILNKQVQEWTSPCLESFETAVELVASIVVHASKKGVGIGLWTIGEKAKRFSIEAGPNQQNRLMRHLAKVQPEERINTPVHLRQDEDNHMLQTTIVFATTTITNDLINQVRLSTIGLVKVFLVLLTKSGLTNEEDDRRIEEIRRYGVKVYVLSEGNIDHAVTSS